MSKAQYDNKQKSDGCSMYEPCEICFKCKVKASHLYERCQSCPVEYCGHDHRKRGLMIRRENFAITVSPETGEMLKELADKALRGNDAE